MVRGLEKLWWKLHLLTRHRFFARASWVSGSCKQWGGWGQGQMALVLVLVLVELALVLVELAVLVAAAAAAAGREGGWR